MPIPAIQRKPSAAGRSTCGRRALDQQGDRQQGEASDHQLPGDQGQHVDRCLPALDQHEPERADQHRPEGAGEPEDVHLPGVADHQQADAEQPDERGRHPHHPGPLADQQPRDAPSPPAARWPGAWRPGRPGGGRPRGRSAGRTGRCCTGRARSPATTSRRSGNRRRAASSTRPTGRARTVAANSGRSGGRNCSVTRYVDPHAIGATAVTQWCRPVVTFHGRQFSFHGR